MIQLKDYQKKAVRELKLKMIDMLNLLLHLLSCHIFRALASTLHTYAEMETGATWVTHRFQPKTDSQFSASRRLHL